MFYKNQSEKSKVMYKRFLNAAAFIGYLNSPSSKKPLIDSRISEEIFCRSFQAKDLGRTQAIFDKESDAIAFEKEKKAKGFVVEVKEDNDSLNFKEHNLKTVHEVSPPGWEGSSPDPGLTRLWSKPQGPGQ